MSPDVIRVEATESLEPRLEFPLSRGLEVVGAEMEKALNVENEAFGGDSTDSETLLSSIRCSVEGFVLPP